MTFIFFIFVVGRSGCALFFLLSVDFVWPRVTFRPHQATTPLGCSIEKTCQRSVDRCTHIQKKKKRKRLGTPPIPYHRCKKQHECTQPQMRWSFFSSSSHPPRTPWFSVISSNIWTRSGMVPLFLFPSVCEVNVVHSTFFFWVSSVPYQRVPTLPRAIERISVELGWAELLCTQIEESAKSNKTERGGWRSVDSTYGRVCVSMMMVRLWWWVMPRFFLISSQHREKGTQSQENMKVLEDVYFWRNEMSE